MTDLKICIATTAFPRWADDFRGIFVYEAARALVKHGCQVKVVAMHNPGAQTHEVLDGIQVFRPPYAPQNWEILQRDSAGIPAAWKARPWARLLLIPFFLRHTVALAKHAADCDLIHANWTLSAISAWAGYPFHHKPWLVTVQGSDIFQAGKIASIRAVTRQALKKTRQVLALSESLAAETSRVAGIPQARIQVVPNGVNLANFPFAEPQTRENLLLFVGTFIERKGGQHLIAALPQVLERFPGYQLAMVGEGPLRPDWQAQINHLGLQDRVRLVGTRTQAEISAWMRRARLFVLPSLEEGQGVVLVEALASGLPCLGTTAGGIPDVITPAVGRLVRPGSPGELGQAICDILEDQTGWEAMCFAARQRAESQYDWEQIAARLVEIYQQVR